MYISKISAQLNSLNFGRKIQIKKDPQLLEAALAVSGVLSIGGGTALSVSGPYAPTVTASTAPESDFLNALSLNKTASQSIENSSPAVLLFMPTALSYSGSDVLEKTCDALKSKQ